MCVFSIRANGWAGMNPAPTNPPDGEGDPLVGAGFIEAAAKLISLDVYAQSLFFMHPIYRIYVAVSLHMSRFFCTFIP